MAKFFASKSPDISDREKRNMERARKIAGILTEVLQSGQEHPRAKVYRKLLSAFGRKEGTALYQTVKDATAQILLERGGPLS